jgi:oxygen-dependent protoporphyrinogen oxidase
MRVAVVGGGISGLAAAWDLRQLADVTVFEPNRLGGCILTTEFDGHPVDEGADAFLTRVPEALELCEELGLQDELVAPAVGASAVWINGGLKRLPDGLVLGAPSDLRGLIRSRILSPLGVARAGLDLVLPRRRPAAGLSVRELIADRFGTQVADRLVDPLVGGIHAGWTGELGAAEVTPQLVAASERARSLILGLRRLPKGKGGPIFMAPRLGLGRMVDVLVRLLGESGVRFLADEVELVRTVPGGQVVVEPSPDRFDAAVVATPPRRTAELLRTGVTVDGLTRVPTASVVLLTASLKDPLPPALNGFLVPRGERRLMTACSFASNKWPHWADPGKSVVRMSAGRHGDLRAFELDDDDLADRLLGELGQALGTTLAPTATRVSRWPDVFPQYLPGHASLVTAVEKSVSELHPGVALAGSTYRGSGIPACIASGRRAAQLVARAAAPAG